MGQRRDGVWQAARWDRERFSTRPGCASAPLLLVLVSVDPAGKGLR